MVVIETIIVGVILISVLVIIHEFGHYAVARAFKVRVSEFMVGLPGPRKTLFKKGGTAFGVTAYPFGGYARIAGMEPERDDPLLAPALGYVYREGATNAERLGWYLYTKGLVKWDQSQAGAEGSSDQDAPLTPTERAEDLLTTLEGWASIELDDSDAVKESKRKAKQEGKAFWPVYRVPAGALGGAAAGQPCIIEDENAFLEEQRKGTYLALSIPKRILILLAGPAMNLIAAIIIIMLILCLNGIYMASTQVGDVNEGGAAQSAGIVAGDTITQIGDYSVQTYSELNSAMASYSPGDSVQVSWTHDGVQQSAQVTLGGEDGNAKLGIYVAYLPYKMSIGEALSYTASYLGTVTVAIINLFNPFQAQEVLSQSSSVVGVAVMATEAIDQGAASVGSVVAAVSVSLGIMNLLPIPPLDGGKILIEVIQAIRRKPVSVRVQNGISIAAMAFFAFLFIYTLGQDVFRISTGFFG